MKTTHQVGTLPYFRVSGQRLEVDEKTGKFTGVVLEPRVRFESLDLGEAERFATDVFRAEEIVLEIHEVPR